MLSLLERVEALRARMMQRDADPWYTTLEREVRGRKGYDGMERVSARAVFDLLELSPKRRNAPDVKIRVRRLMQDLGWTVVDLNTNARGRRAKQRGYVREWKKGAKARRDALSRAAREREQARTGKASS